MQGAVGVQGVELPQQTGTGGRRSRGTAGTGCCSRTALPGTPLLSFDRCRDPAQVRSMGKTGSDCEKLNFDLRTWPAALLEVVVPAQSRGTLALLPRKDSWVLPHGGVGRPQAPLVGNQGLGQAPHRNRGWGRHSCGWGSSGSLLLCSQGPWGWSWGRC